MPLTVTGVGLSVVLLGVVGWYLVAVCRLRARGHRWPWSRVAAALAAAGFAGVAAVPPAAGFSGEVLRHLLLTMAAPVALALAAPVTLALRTTSPRVRRALLRVVRGPVAGALSRGPVVAVLAGTSPWLYYPTPLYAAAHHRPWLHLLVEVHMLLTGCLLAWYLVARDPLRHRPSTGAALTVLVLTAGGHDILAKLMYAHTLPHHGGSPDGVRAGAQLLYYGGDLVTITLAVVVLARWYVRAGRRTRMRTRLSPSSHLVNLIGRE